MYKKAIGLLLLGNLILLLGFACVRGAEAARLTAQPMEQLRLDLEDLMEKEDSMEEGHSMASGFIQR